MQKRAPRRKGRVVNRRRRTNKVRKLSCDFKSFAYCYGSHLQSEGDHSGVEVGAKSEDRKFDEAGTGERRQKKKNRPPRDFCVKLTNLTRDIRVKDLKSELRKRECNPLSITWKGMSSKLSNFTFVL